MAVRLSAICAGRTLTPLPPGRFLLLISVRGWVDPRAIVRLKVLGQLKNLMTSSGIEPASTNYATACPPLLCNSWYIRHRNVGWWLQITKYFCPCCSSLFCRCEICHWPLLQHRLFPVSLSFVIFEETVKSLLTCRVLCSRCRLQILTVGSTPWSTTHWVTVLGKCEISKFAPVVVKFV
jgi:hypothetical protein